jgi:hypothetical protein
MLLYSHYEGHLETNGCLVFVNNVIGPFFSSFLEHFNHKPLKINQKKKKKKKKPTKGTKHLKSPYKKKWL